MHENSKVLLRPCYSPLFLARASRARGKGDHNMVVTVIPDPRAARSLRFSRSARTVDGYHPSITWAQVFLCFNFNLRVWSRFLTGDARLEFLSAPENA